MMAGRFLSREVGSHLLERSNSDCWPRGSSWCLSLASPSFRKQIEDAESSKLEKALVEEEPTTREMHTAPYSLSSHPRGETELEIAAKVTLSELRRLYRPNGGHVSGSQIMPIILKLEKALHNSRM